MTPRSGEGMNEIPPSDDLVVEEPSKPAESVRAGASAMAAREAIGIAISVVTVVLALRIIGPAGYGLLGVPLALFGYGARLGSLGLDVYVLRKSREDHHEVRMLFGLVIYLAGAMTLLVVLAAPWLASAMGVPEAAATVRASAPWLFLTIVTRVPMALLEREMRFRTVAVVELVSIGAYAATAIGGLLAGWGHWSIVVATIVQQTLAFGGALKMAQLSPYWRPKAAVVMRGLRESMAAQGVVWIWTIRDLIGPIFVGHLLGQEALGILTAALLLNARVMFLRQVGWRVGLAVAARSHRSADDLDIRTSSAMTTQAVALSVLLCLFALVARVALPIVVGDEWGPVIEVFPFIAVGSMVNAVFSFESAALLTDHQLRPLAAFHVIYVVTLLVAAMLLVDEGLIGYGIAELIAILPHAYLHREFKKRYGTPDIKAAVYALVVAGFALISLAVLENLALSALISAAAIVALLGRRRTRAEVSTITGSLVRLVDLRGRKAVTEE